MISEKIFLILIEKHCQSNMGPFSGSLKTEMLSLNSIHILKSQLINTGSIVMD